MPSFFMELVERTDEARRAFETNSKVLDIVARGLSIERYRHFLLELYHVVWNFNPVCAAAASRLSDRHQKIRYFLYEHMQEEKGHETWVLNDLEVVGVSAVTARDYRPSLAILTDLDRERPASTLERSYTAPNSATAGPAADQIWTGDQLEDCYGARAHNPAIAPRSRRRGHRASGPAASS